MSLFPNFSILWDGHGQNTFFVLCLILGIVVIVLFHINPFWRNTSIRKLSKLSLFGIGILRIWTLLFLLLLIFQPDIQIEHFSEKPKENVIIIDVSQSMESAWELSSEEVTNRILEKLNQIPEPLTLLDMEGKVLSLDSIQHFLKQYSEFNVDSLLKNQSRINQIMLVSDGQFNHGERPFTKLSQLQVPIFPIYLENVVTKAFVKIQNVSIPQKIPPSENIKGHITLRTQMYKGKFIRLDMKDLHDNKAVLNQRVAIENPEEEIDLEWPGPKQEGAYRYRCQILDDDANLLDEKTIVIRVEDSRSEIWFFAEGAHPFFRVSQNIFPDSLYKNHFLIGQNPILQEGMSPPDLVIVFGDMRHINSKEIFAQIPIDCPTLLIDDPKRALPWIKTLPTFNIIENKKSSLLFTSLDAARHPIFMEAQLKSGKDIAKITQTLPPIETTQSITLDNTWTTLLEWQKGAETIPFVAVNNDSPLGIMTSKSIWRWLFQAPTKDNITTLFQSFCTYLIHQKSFEPVILKASQEILKTGDMLHLTLTVSAQDGTPLENASVLFQQKNDEVWEAIKSMPDGKGRWIASVASLKIGETEFRGIAEIEGKSWGRDSLSIFVESLNLEALSTGISDANLHQIAMLTNGKVLMPTDTISSFCINETFEEKWSWTYPGIRWVLGMWLLVFALLAEWTIRRRKGLL
jgi:hypothetical protein